MASSLLLIILIGLTTSFAFAVSYAEIAAKGPKQSPQEAAAPLPQEIETNESPSSTVSLIDVDTPSVHTVPTDFKEQDVTTGTEAERISREENFDKAAQKAAEGVDKAKETAKDAEKSARKGADKVAAKATASKAKAKKAVGKAKAKAADTAHEVADDASTTAKRADHWLTQQFTALEADHPQAAQAAVVGNFAAVIGLGAFLGFRAWGLHEQGRLLNWKTAATGLAVLSAVGVVEGTFANYFYKAKKSE